ncbi:hypothetical protein [uncultured Draconibacterium sp.]|uniref:hypothetical protein n=1 Tax=uncultured Draconibacterium sp. TaxID=1573823 RepID=UPI0025D82E30|nr:hypothetical protein [uncultured Draconibacterium sp.]
MDELKFSELRKKTQWVGIRITKEERDQLDKICSEEQISKTDFIRYSFRKAINEKTKR